MASLLSDLDHLDTESSPQIKLHALQIIGEEENKLVLAILDHYEILIPKIKGNFHAIYNNMTGVNDDEKRLISFKLSHYKNSLVCQQKDKEETHPPQIRRNAKKGNDPGVNTLEEIDYNQPA